MRKAAARPCTTGSGAASGNRPRATLTVLALTIAALALTAVPASAAPPTVTIGTASDASYTSVHVTGEVDPADLFTYWSFETSTDGVNWSSFNTQGTLAENSGPQTVEADLDGVMAGTSPLQSGTKYFVRLAAVNLVESFPETSEVISPGPDPEFTTLAVESPKVLSAADASDVSIVTAKASGKIKRPANPDSAFNTNCRFEYVTDTKFDATGYLEAAPPIPCGIDSLSAPDEEKSVEATLTGLLPATEYHLRLTASNAGPDASLEAADTFTTDPATAPVIALNPPSGALSSQAHISGTIDPEGGNLDTGFGPIPIAWELQLNPEGAGWEFAEGGVISGEEPEGGGPIPALGTDPITVAKDLTGLSPDSEYEFRLFVSYAGLEALTPAGSFETQGVIAPTVSDLAVSELAGTSARFTAKVNPNGADPLFNTVWHFHCTPSCGEPGGAVVADGSEHLISSEVGGLEPNTAYQVEVAASNSAGADQEGPVPFKTLTLPPSVQTGYATEVEATSATIAAKLNPRNSEITYQFEYGTDESYGTKIPDPAASLPDIDNTLHTLTQPLTDLREDTTYHFRLTATNIEAEPDEVTHGVDHTFTTPPASGPKACPNQQLRAENSSLALPDCRAYEMVSPLQKGGSDVGIRYNGNAEGEGTNGGYAQSTSAGDGVVYFTQGSVGEATDGLSKYSTSRRHDDGWTTRTALPSGDRETKEVQQLGIQWVTFSPQLDQAIWGTRGAYLSEMPEPPEAVDPREWASGVYRGSTSGSIEWLNRSPALGEYERVPIGSSPELDTTYFYAVGGPELIPGEGPRISRGAGEVFEYSADGLKSAGLLPPDVTHPDGVQPPGGSAPANITSRDFNPANYVSSHTSRGQVSRDGSTLYFLSPDPKLGEPTQLYVRRGGQSTLVSHDEGGDPTPSGAAPVANGLPGPPVTQTLSDSGYQYVYGSPDGSMAIFQSEDQLTDDAPINSALKAYRYDVSTDSLTYLPGVGGMTVVASSDDGTRFLMFRTSEAEFRNPIAVWDHGQITTFATVGPSGARAHGNVVPARATSSGSAFVFLARNVPGFNSDAGNPNGPYEVYRYDLADAQLSCLSCPLDSIVPSGSAGLGAATGGLALNPIISEDANRVFFDSPDPLVPADTDKSRDVYEWTPGGVSLISAGHSDADSFVLANSPSGDDVFFSTREGIDPDDTDGLYDVYDARVNGGFPQTDAVTPCDNNAVCHGTTPPEPIRPAVGSHDQRSDTPKFTISAGKLSSAKLKFIITAPVAATVDASGRRLRSTHRAISEPGRFKLLIPLKRGAINALTRGHRLALTVHLHFSPATGGPSSADRVLTVKG